MRSKARVLHWVGTAWAVALSAAAASGWDFTYGYQTVNDPNADTYLVEKQHAKKVKDWSGGSYWGPNANDVQATVTYKFSFPAPPAEVFLHARLQTYNYAGDQSPRTDFGFTSLWASPDGTSWRLLLDNPTPTTVMVADVTYNQSLPASLLGATNLWIQARMQQHDAMLYFQDPAATWTDSQFSRANPSDTNEVFQLKARFGAAPQLSAMVQRGRLPWRTAVAAAATLVCLGLMCLVLVCVGLLCVLVRRSGRQVASHAEVLRRLDDMSRRLEQGQHGLSPKEPGPRG